MDWDELKDVDINLHAFFVNIFGLLDNMAWIAVYERNRRKGINKKDVGLYKSTTQEILNDDFKQYLNSDRMRKWHDEYLKNYRDALAHRIPLYVPPKSLTPDQQKQVAGIEEKRSKAIKGGDFSLMEDLQSVNGISKHSALFLKLVKDISILYMEKGLHDRDLLSSPQVVCDYLKVALKGLSDEEFCMLFFDGRNQLIEMETLKTGTVNRAVVFPRKIVERALYHHAVSVIVAHNHPSGALQPSQEDRDITRTIKEALKTVDISLLDHIIIGGNEYFSFKEKGLM
ncbi:MAG: DNA repair protein RadC [Candidatus Omnitrophota bacterium]